MKKFLVLSAILGFAIGLLFSSKFQQEGSKNRTKADLADTAHGQKL
jgi:hypothetical protein